MNQNTRSTNVVEYNICKCITLVQYMSLSKDKCSYWSDQNTSWRSEISWVTPQIALGLRESAVTYIRFLGTSEYRMSHIPHHFGTCTSNLTTVVNSVLKFMINGTTSILKS